MPIFAITCGIRKSDSKHIFFEASSLRFVLSFPPPSLPSFVLCILPQPFAGSRQALLAELLQKGGKEDFFVYAVGSYLKHAVTRRLEVARDELIARERLRERDAPLAVERVKRLNGQ
eukprot:9491679-Pyramimonas_sp.AAC.1